jgi:hypothetical protein
MFEPKGEEAIWKLIYKYVVDLPVGTVVSFKELEDAINDNFEKNRSSVYRATKEMAKVNKKYLVSERGVGYKIVEGTPMLWHAEERHEKANRQIKMANFEALNINTKVMTIEEKKRWSQFLAWNGTVLNALSSNAENIAKAGFVAQVATDAVMDQLNKLKAQINGYEQQMNKLQESVA